MHIRIHAVADETTCDRGNLIHQEREKNWYQETVQIQFFIVQLYTCQIMIYLLYSCFKNVL